jgi:hypothetical protein
LDVNSGHLCEVHSLSLSYIFFLRGGGLERPAEMQASQAATSPAAAPS